jgi:hypothetical protein
MKTATTKLDIIGFYWDGTTSWTIYQKPNGSTLMKKRKQ